MVLTGLELLLREPPAILRGRRLGLLCHAASVTADLTSAIDALLAHPDLKLTAVFGPQHGLTSHTQDNMIEWASSRDRRTGLPVYSLYGEVRRPTPEMLAEVDAVVVDLQDVGTRVYTYVWTMTLVMEACAEAGLPVVVLDRPNPLGGAREGPLLQSGYESFVGRYPIPLRHGLTIAELARLCNNRFGIGAELWVVPMRGWRREMPWAETGLPWVMPSPNMPTLDTALVYPGAVLFEGTTLSEGRGTTRPFEILGAPGVDGHALAAAMAVHDLNGVRFRPLTFEPTFQKHAGRLCGGVQLHLTDPAAFRPVLTAALLLAELRRGWPEAFGWLPPPYEYVHDRLPIDILAGGPVVRSGVEAGWRADEWQTRLDEGVEAFAETAGPALLYDGS